jgi:soluble lytic murein transglycosylase-like protein
MGNRTSDVSQWLPLVAGHFNPEDVETALCLIGFESGGNPNARNQSSGASGLMQILPSWAPKFGVSREDLFKPEINLYIARQLKDDGGWRHWSPYKRGECR